MTSPDAPQDAARPSRFRWVRAAADRVPTKWIAGAATVAFLAATAAFGGMADAAQPGPEAMAAGEEYGNDQFAVTVERAVLVDELPGGGVYPEEGERVLGIVLAMTNVWDEPQSAVSGGELMSALTVDGLDTPANVARLDDATGSPVLQPDVPAEIVMLWAVDADSLTAGDVLTVTIADQTLHTGSFVTEGRWWDDPVAAATVEVELTDVGAGT